MAKQYSTKDFFRRMPNAQFSRYFKKREIFSELDFSTMKEGKPDKLFDAWLALEDSARNAIDAEFRDIFTMCCEKGFLAILDEARWQLRETPEDSTAFVEMLSALPNHFERAMTTFLDYKDFWKGATLFYHADTLPYWRKRKNLPCKLAAVDSESIEQLTDLISNYFHHTEGRGRNCVVEPYRRNELDYFFCYPEDHSQHSIEWVDGEFNPRPHNPAFEVVYVYSQNDGTLDLNFRGSYKAVEPLQEVFAIAILKLPELPQDSKDERIYDLNLLKQRSFTFTYDVGSGIEDVVVKKLRLSSRVKKGDRITLEADPSQNRNAVYDLFDEINKSTVLNQYNVTQVELAASIAAETGKPAKTVTIRLTHPNSCSLKYEELDLKLRYMLAASDIEPRKPAQVTAVEKEAEEIIEA